MMKLGEKIKQLRIEKGMTQDDLAAAIGTTKASISNYERNQRSPQYAVLNLIADTLGASLSELLAYGAAEERNYAEEAADNTTDNKRPVRVKRLLAAFDRLSDEAQKKAVERVEELALIPIYQLPLPEALQRYIYSQYQQTYELSDDIKSQETNGSDDGTEIDADIRHIILKREKGECQSKWHFIYYQFSGRPDDSAVKEIVSQYESYDNKQDRYSFVLDNEECYDQFINCHEDIRSQDDLAPGSNLASGKAEITFFLISRDTWEIKDMDTSNRYSSELDI